MCSALSFAVELTKNQVNKYKFLILEDRKNMKMIKVGVFGIAKKK